MNVKSILAAVTAMLVLGCTNQNTQGQNGDDPLPSWNDTDVKKKIVDFLEVKARQIPEKDRIAVFDMDGTIICEHPMWCEMAVASQKMSDQIKVNPRLSERTCYQYAEKITRNPADTSILNNWVVDGRNYLDSIICKAFTGVDHEEYVSYARNLLENTPIIRYGIPYSEAFYQPMLELIDYFRAKKFEVYIVSGSMQGVVWAAIPDELGFDRQHLIGTCQQTTVSYDGDGEASYVIGDDIIKPKNNRDGKSINIYNRIGKVPVVAIGNNTGDFGMFRLVSTSRHPHLVMMINHDDADREFKYNPYYDKVNPGWQDTLNAHRWIQADMSKEFKVVFKGESDK